MDVALGDGALRVARVDLHVCLRVAGGGGVRDRSVARSMPSLRVREQVKEGVFMATGTVKWFSNDKG
jgi:hypothetical protein